MGLTDIYSCSGMHVRPRSSVVDACILRTRHTYPYIHTHIHTLISIDFSQVHAYTLIHIRIHTLSQFILHKPTYAYLVKYFHGTITCAQFKSLTITPTYIHIEDPHAPQVSTSLPALLPKSTTAPAPRCRSTSV
jgi:hypothetical protein